MSSFLENDPLLVRNATAQAQHKRALRRPSAKGPMPEEYGLISYPKLPPIVSHEPSAPYLEIPASQAWSTTAPFLQKRVCPPPAVAQDAEEAFALQLEELRLLHEFERAEQFCKDSDLALQLANDPVA